MSVHHLTEFENILVERTSVQFHLPLLHISSKKKHGNSVKKQMVTFSDHYHSKASEVNPLTVFFSEKFPVERSIPAIKMVFPYKWEVSEV